MSAFRYLYIVLLAGLSLLTATAHAAPPEHFFKIGGGVSTSTPVISYNAAKGTTDPGSGSAASASYWKLYAASPRSADLYFGLEWLQQTGGEYANGASSYTENLGAGMFNGMYKGKAIFAGGGIGYASVELEDITGVTLKGTAYAATGTHKEEGLAWQIFMGIEKKLFSHLNLGLLYRYIGTKPSYQLSLGELEYAARNQDLSVTLSVDF